MADDGETEEIVAAEEAAARRRRPDRPLGTPGQPIDRRSPFYTGLTWTAGALIMIGVARLVIGAADMLILIGLAFFIAIGLDPAVAWLTRHRVPRGLAVTIVVLVTLGLLAGFMAAAITPLAEQATQFVRQVPRFLQTLHDHSSLLGQLNERFHVTEQVQRLLTGPALTSGLLGAGAAVFNAVTSLFIVLILMIYFLADLPRIRRFLYRLAPASRRPRAILMGDEIFAKVGAYVLGNLATSVITGVATFTWLWAFHVPYALLLAIIAAVLDLVPVIGTVIAGVVIVLTSLTVSLPAGLATLGFIIAYKVLEDYLLAPKIIGRVVEVPAVATVVAVLIGGALLGVVGALVAIPVAAAILLILREITFPRLDQL
jgi:predicted PurR-regulated permease PerM